MVTKTIHRSGVRIYTEHIITLHRTVSGNRRASLRREDAGDRGERRHAGFPAQPITHSVQLTDPYASKQRASLARE